MCVCYVHHACVVVCVCVCVAVVVLVLWVDMVPVCVRRWWYGCYGLPWCRGTGMAVHGVEV